ncbi:MAG: ROK family protein [Alphaproteobacteria bacterium]|nr:ROK family protein [Alphaproteobacteria bacterium]
MRIGIDLGGTKIEALALDLDGHEVYRHRIQAPQGDYRATVDAVAGLVALVEQALGTKGSIGIGIPGAISPHSGLIKHANSTWMTGQPFERDMAKRLGRPVRLANDADCFALSEATDGAGADAGIVFGAILGTGVGGGIVTNGRLLGGPNAIAGEWGHNPLPWPHDGERPGPPCYCGKSGCIETFLSGPGLARDYAAATGTRVPAAEVAQRLGVGEPEALAALARYTDRLARSLATVINLIDPDVIVLGGGVSNIAALYAPLPARLADYVFSKEPIVTRIVPARFGDSSGVRGAAWLWPA